jgi:hypothetical protein
LLALLALLATYDSSRFALWPNISVDFCWEVLAVELASRLHSQFI